MRIKPLMTVPLLCCVSLLSSCVIDGHGHVWPAPIVVGMPGPVMVAPGYVDGPWGPYGAPYFVYGNYNYYIYGGRYCYYDHGHRVYVSHLPSGGYYYHGHRGYR